jgi:GT2 family glycosyltransferase
MIVVDNDSNDGSSNAISEKYPDVKLIASKKNLGFAYANNIAAQHASGAYILLLNPDTIVLNGALEKLYNFAKKHPENLVYGGRTLHSDHSLNPTSCWKKPSLWSLFCYSSGLTSLFKQSAIFDPESYGCWKRDTVKNVDIVTGCLLMMDIRLWKKLGGFDKKFFMYGEDADICIRAMTEGARPIITPDATIIHYQGASEKIRADKMIRMLRAKQQLLLTHWGPQKAKLGCLLLNMSVFTRLIATKILMKIMTKGFQKDNMTWQQIWNRRKEWIVV